MFKEFFFLKFSVAILPLGSGSMKLKCCGSNGSWSYNLIFRSQPNPCKNLTSEFNDELWMGIESLLKVNEDCIMPTVEMNEGKTIKDELMKQCQ